MKLKKLYILFSLLFISVNTFSQQIQLSDSAKISLLTNYPWDKQVYALFGHTALRVQDEVNGIDVAFNYGIFDFDSSDFLYRFVKGETDYMVVPIKYSYYIGEYNNREVSTFEQALNLTHPEKQAVWDALCINALPENRVYRYNFFFDNCSTRPRDIIENNLLGTVQYGSTGDDMTFRDLLYTHLIMHPWTRFGIDLIIGNGADRIATEDEKMFLPLFLKKSYENAVIIDDEGYERPLVEDQHFVSRFNESGDSFRTPDYPFITGCFVFAACLLLLMCVCCKEKPSPIGRIFDVLLFGVAGVAGCIIFFLMFFSEHPATYPNWNIIWLNPMQLLLAPLFFVKKLSKYISYYHFINFALLSLFLLGWWFIPQSLELAFVPYILSLWLRSGTNFVQYQRWKL
ncbi:DUF4105 domain-containing protein [Dysgonomonas sp. 216]|uniref:lipoprotein N-acyltransferase Lnb domain-containing protein n=1 Tax=Dysgonomonas sp. 216 TaxID=2302934 RepID=UPI0013D3F612|nr:DUF4105 domain-containing protein [Dysgonomonas sp. 216]